MGLLVGVNNNLRSTLFRTDCAIHGIGRVHGKTLKKGEEKKNIFGKHFSIFIKLADFWLICLLGFLRVVTEACLSLVVI